MYLRGRLCKRNWIRTGPTATHRAKPESSRATETTCLRLSVMHRQYVIPPTLTQKHSEGGPSHSMGQAQLSIATPPSTLSPNTAGSSAKPTSTFPPSHTQYKTPSLAPPPPFSSLYTTTINNLLYMDLPFIPLYQHPTPKGRGGISFIASVQAGFTPAVLRAVLATKVTKKQLCKVRICRQPRWRCVPRR